MKTILFVLLIILSSCSQKVYDNSLSDQRKKHTQRIVSRDITEGRIYLFTCIGLGMWLGVNVFKKY